MTWQITWSLILGFTLSAVIEALVRKSTIVRLPPDDRPRSLATAAGVGAASSSCSYAAMALARSLFGKGANFTAAMGLPTRLDEPGHRTRADPRGAARVAVHRRGVRRRTTVDPHAGTAVPRFLAHRLVQAATDQAARAVAGSMEGHAATDMSISGDGYFWRRPVSPAGLTSISHNFVMEWAAILRTSSSDYCSPAQPPPGSPTQRGSTCSSPATLAAKV